MHILASDYDRTLFFNGGFKEEDLKAIKQFQEAGNLFGLCTGRAFKSVEEEMKDDIRCDFYLMSSGAQIMDGNKNIIYHKYISKQTMIDITKAVFKIRKLFVQSTEGYYLNLKYNEEIDHVNSIYADLEPELDSIPEEILGFTVECKDVDEARMWVEKLRLMPEISAYQNEKWIDMVAEGCSKGTAMQWLRKYYNNPVAGIGDSFNDLPLLNEADLSFTFHSSNQSVQNSADVLVDSIAEAIEYLMKIED